MAIEGEEPSTRRLGEMDADLLQGGPHAVRPQLRRFLHWLPHLIDLARARFACVPLWDIFEALVAEQGPSFEHFIHPVARRLQVGGYCCVRSSFRAEIDNRAAALVGIGDLSIGEIAPSSHGRRRAVSQNALDCVIAWPSFKAEKTNRGNLVRSYVPSREQVSFSWNSGVYR